MDQKQRWRNFFANVSHIHIKPTVTEETIKELAFAAKNVENRPLYHVDTNNLYTE